jgi:hypothetical protein
MYESVNPYPGSIWLASRFGKKKRVSKRRMTRLPLTKKNEINEIYLLSDRKLLSSIHLNQRLAAGIFTFAY